MASPWRDRRVTECEKQAANDRFRFVNAPNTRPRRPFPGPPGRLPRALLPMQGVSVSDSSGVEWCDATWNPVRRCDNGEMGFDLGLVPSRLTEPFGWKSRLRICVNPISDLFEDCVADSSIDRVFAAMALAPRHTFAVLTKHAARMRAYLTDAALFMRMVEACNRAPDGSEAVSGVTPNLTTL